MQESIYNIIPKEYTPPVKGSLYKSKYPPNIPPTGSTFCHKTTSKPGVGNLSGQFQLGLQAHTEYGQTKTFGHLKGDRKPSPQNFRKKNTGTMGNETLPPSRNFSYDCKHKKQPIPSKNDKPIHGQKSDKNFIASNAIQNILSVAKKMPQSVDWTKKKNYGKIPNYIQKIKQNIHNQYKMIQNLNTEQQKQKQKPCLSEREVAQLREGLKRKWDQINKQYQKKTYIRNVDTLGLKNRKQQYERQLAQIQRDIKALNKLYVFVEE